MASSRIQLGATATILGFLCLLCVSPSIPLPAEMAIIKPVGEGSANSCADVRTVQYLLNQIPAQLGGAANQPLAIDGKMGAETRAAIEKFQEAHDLPKDGRVDPSGSTIQRLNELNPSGDFKPGRSGKINPDGTTGRGPHPGPPIAFGNLVAADFKSKVLQIAVELEADPSHLMAAIYFESAGTFRPDVNNPVTCAVGLIQFMRTTAEGLGTTQFDLMRMDAVDQLDYVKAHMARFRGKLNTLEDVYLSILRPVMVGKPNSAAVLSLEANPVEYQRNIVLDQNRDGTITKTEASKPVYDRLMRGMLPENAG